MSDTLCVAITRLGTLPLNNLPLAIVLPVFWIFLNKAVAGVPYRSHDHTYVHLGMGVLPLASLLFETSFEPSDRFY